MATGKTSCKFVIAVDAFGDAMAINIPQEQINAWDGTMLCDNGFYEGVPTAPGLYELDCVLHWDDGRHAFFECTDPDWRYEILNVKLLYGIEG